MAKVTKTEEELRQKNMQEAVSKTEEFFKKYGNMMYGCILAVLIAALAVLAYNRFILQPKKQQATDQMVQAERWFLSGEYELALNGDDNDPGLLEIIDQYGSKAGEAVYMYAGIAALKTGDYENAIAQLKKYDGKDPILKGRAEACIGDAYAELQDYANAIAYYQKAAKTTDNALAATYILKAGIMAEETGDKAQALSFYKEIKDKWGNAPEAMEIDKYISRIEIAE
ncbi:MAG: tetratricopeptide repeat protein [Bacteroidales bacterium]|nr:tetratricopeptide repeat protein [Bacteroidales bacterium]